MELMNHILRYRWTYFSLFVGSVGVTSFYLTHDPWGLFVGGLGLGFSVMFWGEVTTKDLLATYARHEALANRVIEEQQELIRLMNNTSA